jgi:DNA mismatch repair ATPase MutS
LKNADFDELLAKMNNRDKRSSLELLHEYMDYRLEKVGAGYETPKDALNVARLIGLDEEIISLATRILEDTGKRKEE